MCDRAPRPETQQHRIHRSPEEESHPVATVDAPRRKQGVAAPCLANDTIGGVGGEGPALPGVATSS